MLQMRAVVVVLLRTELLQEVDPRESCRDLVLLLVVRKDCCTLQASIVSVEGLQGQPEISGCAPGPGRPARTAAG